MGDSLDSWFLREIVSLEPALMRYISRAWPDRDEADDIRQEIYTKVYEAVATVRPALPRQFLFTIARNLILDRLRHGQDRVHRAARGFGVAERPYR